MACVAEPVKKRDRTHRIACVKQCVCTSAFSYDACCSIFARHEHGTHLPRQLLSTLKLPPVQDGTELRTALKRVGAIRADALQAVEVLWTPQEEGDTLSEDELLGDYPQLNIL